MSEVSELSFISDTRLKELVASLLSRYKTALSAKDDAIYRNVIDPFSSIFDAMQQGIPLSAWLGQERSRQTQKTLQNMVGEFHQHVLGSIPGWEDLGIGGGIDLRNREMRIIAEIKNKHNTLNSGGLVSIYDKLQKHLDFDESYEGFTAYCIMVIPSNPNPMNVPFCPSDKGTQRPRREDIRKIDGKSFYSLATGEREALQNLYSRIPVIVGEILDLDPVQFAHSTTFMELFKRAYLKKGSV